MELYRLTTIAALIQPPSETFYLFDDVMLLAEGKIIFHGPVHHAIPFFCSLGFKCPPRKDPAAFLTELTTPEGNTSPHLNHSSHCSCYVSIEYYKLMLNDSATDFAGQMLVSLDVIQQAFWESEIGANMLNAVTKAFTE